jgi:hypothetical protein
MKIKSYDGHAFGTDYVATLMGGTGVMMPDTPALMVPRLGNWPVVSGIERPGRKLVLGISIEGASTDSLRTQLFQWMSPNTDESPASLVVTDDDLSDERYLSVICESLQVKMDGDAPIKTQYIATLAVHDDARWRAIADTSDAWSITASGQTHAITNAGEEEAYPVYTIKPTGAKGAGYAYRRWVAIQWMTTNAGVDYPFYATLDTATLTTAKMQADGDDLRVLVDGKEVYRWLDAMDSAATKIWFAASFAGAPLLTLKTAIAASGAITSIELNQDISGLPDSGILYIGTEAFVYSARNTVDNAVTGITRAAKGTAEGAHAIAARVHWIQHDIYILYGNAAATAPTVDDNYKPCMELDHSTNTSWVYEVFGNYAFQDWGDTIKYMGEHRPGRWTRGGPNSISGNGGVYTATQRMNANPYSVMGIWVNAQGRDNYDWQLYNPCGIVNAAYSNGYKRRASTGFIVRLGNWVRGSNWWAYRTTGTTDIAAPTNPNAWEAASYSGAAFATSDAIEAALFYNPSDIEFGDAVVTLNSLETPVITVGAEQGNYHLQATLTNQTTGEAIGLDFVMNVNSELEIDTANRTVTWLADNSRQLQALTQSGTRTTQPAKRHWLRLLAGSNTLRFDDTGTGNVTLTTEYRKRYY